MQNFLMTLSLALVFSVMFLPSVSYAQGADCSPVLPRCEALGAKAQKLMKSLPEPEDMIAVLQAQDCMSRRVAEVSRGCAKEYRAAGNSVCVSLLEEQARTAEEEAKRFEKSWRDRRSL